MENVYFAEMKIEYLEEVLDIYSYYVKNTTVTFHDKDITKEEMMNLVFFENPKYRTFTIFQEGRLCGYVIMTQHKPREAYDGTAGVTIYLSHEFVGKGIGTQAIKYIEQYARSQEIHVLIATICGSNSQSINLFESQGYFKCAHYKEVGKKFNQLLDIVVYQKILNN